MKKSKSPFQFDKQERNGIFFLLLVIVALQGTLFFVGSKPFQEDGAVLLDSYQQAQIDSLKQISEQNRYPKKYAFNPNFITDYRGYVLGMSTEEIDRLVAFRKKGSFVNSPEEFQKITQISDSLLNAMAPYFKFPIWKNNGAVSKPRYYADRRQKPAPAGTIKDLNKVTPMELMEVYGIGDKLSKRIIKFRERLGGFLVNEQLYDVYGLDSVVVERTLKRFQVFAPPKIEKININSASVRQISDLVYIKYGTAVLIVEHRDQNGPFESMEKLAAIPGFPSEKIDRIGLYLSL